MNLRNLGSPYYRKMDDFVKLSDLKIRKKEEGTHAPLLLQECVLAIRGS